MKESARVGGGGFWGDDSLVWSFFPHPATNNSNKMASVFFMVFLLGMLFSTGPIFVPWGGVCKSFGRLIETTCRFLQQSLADAEQGQCKKAISDYAEVMRINLHTGESD